MVQPKQAVPSIFGAKGETPSLMRAFDWSSMPLGAPDTWPQSLRSALNICLNSQSAACIFWGPQCFLLYNDAWSAILGDRHHKALGRTAAEAWPELWEQFGARLGKVLRDGDVIPLENLPAPARRHARGERHFDFNFSPIWDEGGGIAGVFSIATETGGRGVTERRTAPPRRLAETLLRERERKFRSLAENIPDLIFRYDTNCRRVYANPAAARAIGRLNVVFAGQAGDGPPDISHEKGAELMARLLCVMESLQLIECEERSVEPDGTVRLFHTRYVPEGGECGVVTGVLVIAHDITERVREREELAKSNEELDCFFTLALNMFCIASIDGVFLRLNPAWEDALGYPLAELINTRYLDLVHPDDVAPTLAAMAALGAQREVLAFVNRYRCKDGSYRWIEWRSAAAGGLVYAAAIDITERKRAEQQILELNRDLERRVAERTAQLNAVNKELESFSSSVSHELRVPLRAIDGFSRVLLDDYTNVLDAEGQRYLDLVIQSTARMRHLIDDILTFSRTSQCDLETESVDLAAMAREMFAELRAVAPERNIRFVVGDLPSANCDRTTIRQVLSNLLGNAIKYTGSRPEAVIEFSGTAGNTETVYCVKDNGVGFDMRYVDKLFDMFQRLHSIEEFEGSGVGLAIVKRIVERHGGRVWAEAKVGDGATVCFALPAARPGG